MLIHNPTGICCPLLRLCSRTRQRVGDGHADAEILSSPDGLRYCGAVRILWPPSHAGVGGLLHKDAVSGQVEVAAEAGVGVAVGGVGDHVLVGIVVVMRVSGT